jgi:hypothetical protein
MVKDMTDEELCARLGGLGGLVGELVRRYRRNGFRVARLNSQGVSLVLSETPVATPLQPVATPFTCERHGYGVLVVRDGPCPVCALEGQVGQ